MLRTALIGYPATGKTTLFQLMTEAHDAPRAAHGKLEATLGMARVPDPRLDVLTAMYNPRKRVPATVEFADIPGRASGAGADALLDVAAYRNADALVHVVRAFTDPAIPHAAGSVDPRRDARAMEDELILADLAVVEKRLERLAKDLKKTRTAELEREQAILLALQAAPRERLAAARAGARRRRPAAPARLPVPLGQAAAARPQRRRGATWPRDSSSCSTRHGLADLAAGPQTRAVALCAKIELEIAQLEPADAAAFLADLGLAASGLDRVIRASYELLGYISFFTVGEDECRAWSIPRGTPAQAAAGEIHTDLSRGFIRAEVVAYDRLIARGSMAACRDHGEVRLEGKEYIVLDGDIINVRFAT